MQDQEPAKLQKAGKFYALFDILYRKTDDAHSMTSGELISEMQARGFTCRRRTLIDNIRLLEQITGRRVVSCRGGGNTGYCMPDKLFTPAEARALFDAVQASAFIPPDKAVALTEKISGMLSCYQQGALEESSWYYNRRKHSNEEIYASVVACGRALQGHSSLRLRYYDIGPDHTPQYRYGGEPVTVDPFALVCHEDNYYLLALRSDIEDEKEARRTYRLDRMTDAEALPDPVLPRTEKYFGSAAEYTRSVFRMFGGEEAQVTLRFPADLCGPVYDKFGEQIRIILPPSAEGECELTETVQIADTFFSWVGQFRGEMRITAPESVREQYREHLRRLMAAAEG